MNNDRTVLIKNIGTCPIGLRDTQNRRYGLGAGEKMRISKITLQDILDRVTSKKIFEMGLVQVGNITPEDLYNMGLTEEEIDKLLDKSTIPAVVIKEDLAEEKEEVIEIEEPVIEEKVEEPVVEETTVVEEKPTPVKRTLGKFTISQDGPNFRYRLKASNGELLVVSELYTSEKACRTGIETIKKNAETAKVEIVDCVEITEEYANHVRQVDPVSYICGDFTPGRYAWILRNPQIVNPIPISGKLGLWNYNLDE